MVVNQRRRVGRTPTGGRYKQYRSKRLHEAGDEPALTRVAEENQKKQKRGRGGTVKTYLVEAHIVNLFDPKAKKYTKATVTSVVENPANRHFVRRNVMTKGSIIDTDKGRARVTNRPGQEGAVNAVLV